MGDSAATAAANRRTEELEQVVEKQKQAIEILKKKRAELEGKLAHASQESAVFSFVADIRVHTYDTLSADNFLSCPSCNHVCVFALASVDSQISNSTLLPAAHLPQPVLV